VCATTSRAQAISVMLKYLSSYLSLGTAITSDAEKAAYRGGFGLDISDADTNDALELSLSETGLSSSSFRVLRRITRTAS
jgi:hypothetical protein